MRVKPINYFIEKSGVVGVFDLYKILTSSL